MNYLIKSKPAFSHFLARDPFADFGHWIDDVLGVTVRPSERQPFVDVREKDDHYLLTAELPGVGSDDLRVSVEDGKLSIEAESEKDREDKDDEYLRRERVSYNFKRSFVLPKEVDQEKIGADFKNGVLVLTLPKQETAQSRKIEIKLS